MRSYYKIVCCFIAGVICFISFTASSQTEANREYQIKAVFLFNFIQFVEWPKDAFANDTAPFVIGILGNDPFDSYLVETVMGEKLGEHPVVVHRYDSPEEIKTCHILFIGKSDKQEIKEILDQLNDKNILTVSDTKGFGQLGGIITLVTQNGKIKLQVNTETAKEANLTLSSKLLRLAEIVY